MHLSLNEALIIIYISFHDPFLCIYSKHIGCAGQEPHYILEMCRQATGALPLARSWLSRARSWSVLSDTVVAGKKVGHGRMVSPRSHQDPQDHSQVWVLDFMQGRIQELVTVKSKKAYSEMAIHFSILAWKSNGQRNLKG